MSDEYSTFAAHPLCPPHLRKQVEEGSETAERDADRAERQARTQQQEEGAIEVVSKSPGASFPPPPGHKRTPGKSPTPARAAQVLPQSPEQPSPPPSPPSTAPAILCKGRGGRKRRRTAKEAEAKAQGWLPES